MARNLQEYVAENRQNIKRIDTRFISVEGGQRQRNLTFTDNTFEVAITVAAYERDLNDGLYSGHPNAKHGSGRGVAGDQRGAWTEAFSGATTAVFTRDGRNAVRDALDGQAIAAKRSALGTGTDAAAVSDSTLVAKTDDTWSYSVKDGVTETRNRGSFRFSQHPLTVEEWGVTDNDGRIMARATRTLNTSNEKEVRLDVTFNINGDGAGDTVITTAGEQAAADSIRALSETVGLEEIAFGTGTSDFSKSDTGLTSEEYRKNVQRRLESERITARMWTAEGEPGGQPVDLSEVGVFTNTGEMVFAATLDPFEKTDQYPFISEATFRVQ